MKFLIADTFSNALLKLTAQEQKAVKITVFDLQQDPSSPGLQFHRIDKSKDRNFWSIRVGRDIRIIVHKTAGSFLVCYVDHHDDAYSWAERRRIDTHPRTGAAQIVEVRERVEEIPVFESVPGFAEEQVSLPLPGKPATFPFESLNVEDILQLGVPEDWVEDIKGATEDRFLDLAVHLPGEASEALLEYISTGLVPQLERAAFTGTPFEHPDAQRRFRIMENVEELQLALEYPWEKWILYLHPAQQGVVDRDFNGPARVSGSAGTGKTVVALHRAMRVLQEDDGARLLLTTFSEPLSNSLEHKLGMLMSGQDSTSHHATTLSFKGVAKDLFTLIKGHDPRPASQGHVRAALKAAADGAEDGPYTERFLMSEWNNVIDAWQLASLEDYKTVPRLGRKNRLGSKQRERLWPIFEATRRQLETQGRLTWPMVFGVVESHYANQDRKPFTHIVVDEAQDLGVPELRMLAAISEQGANRLFFAGDLGQRIFQEPFSWMKLGIDIRGRSNTLKVNYRTSHQIRETVDRLLPTSLRDVDGNEEERTGTVSVFNGPSPEVQLVDTPEAEKNVISSWLRSLISDGTAPEEIGVFVRSEAELHRARAAVQSAGLEALELSERVEDPVGRVSIGTMHLAKGLEFKGVAVMACDDEILPQQARIETVGDETELEEVFDTERHLFYVACTRARDQLLVTGVKPGSEFLEDLGAFSC
ncbi:3'-5' exonuclease [Roseibium album]|uniref:3'-5' exonuclease n=1 Tax=Roseibium album TaxID=311410 RepID=UPI002490F9FE|nr:3'-5' exonuclease [Roseibium album]